MLNFKQVFKSNLFQWDSDMYLRLNVFYSEWQWVPVWVMRHVTRASDFHSDMHELMVNYLIICGYLNITDLLVSLAKVKIKLISFSTDEFILASVLNSNTMIKALLNDCCEQLTAGLHITKCCYM